MEYAQDFVDAGTICKAPAKRPEVYGKSSRRDATSEQLLRGPEPTLSHQSCFYRHFFRVAVPFQDRRGFARH